MVGHTHDLLVRAIGNPLRPGSVRRSSRRERTEYRGGENRMARTEEQVRARPRVVKETLAIQLEEDGRVVSA